MMAGDAGFMAVGLTKEDQYGTPETDLMPSLFRQPNTGGAAALFMRRRLPVKFPHACQATC